MPLFDITRICVDSHQQPPGSVASTLQITVHLRYRASDAGGEDGHDADFTVFMLLIALTEGTVVTETEGVVCSLWVLQQSCSRVWHFDRPRHTPGMFQQVQNGL